MNVSVLKGAQFIPIVAMQSKGLDKKYGLNLKIIPVASPTSNAVAIMGHQVDLAFNTWQAAALHRSKGGDSRVIGPVTSYGDGVIVKKDSPAKSLNDLVGKKVGTFLVVGPGIALVFRYAVQKEFGFDINSKFELREAAVPLLLALLEKGEIDAVSVGEPNLSKALASGKYRQIWDVNVAFKKLGKVAPMQVCVVTTDRALQTKKEALKRFLVAFAETKDVLTSDNRIWKELAKEVDVKGDEAIEMLRKRMQPRYVQTWNKGFVDNDVKLNYEMQALHEGVKILPDKIPEGLFSFDLYNK